MSLPASLIQSLQHVPGFDAEAFEAVHASGKKITSVRLNPARSGVLPAFMAAVQPVPWAALGYYLPERPSFTLDPLFHAGCYYVQEASSMFLEHALKQVAAPDQPLIVLDLCAAPGGKSTHIQSLLSPESVLVSNEVIKSRVNILSENLTKWGAANTIVTNNDPADFSGLEGLFDVIVVDAPCSGSGLFRKEPEAMAEWSEASVALCSQRQQRILADIWPALKPGGVLIYSTCSYSESEDEAIADWLAADLQAENIPLQVPADWHIIETGSPLHQNKGYRFFPQLLDGEGFYISCFKKREEEPGYFEVKPFKNQPDKKVAASAAAWLEAPDAWRVYQHKEQVFGMPPQVLQLFGALQKQLNIRKAGVKLGDWARDEIIPDHALALSGLLKKDFQQADLDLEEALHYLRKNDFELPGSHRGWTLIRYKEQPLGWVKSMGNRFNNYYPKEWRIRQQ